MRQQQQETIMRNEGFGGHISETWGGTRRMPRVRRLPHRERFFEGMDDG